MIKLLEKAVETVRELSPQAQEKAARLLLQLAANDREPEGINPAHMPGILRGLAQARARQFATDEEVEATFRRFDP